MSVTFRVDGLRELGEAMKSLGEDMAKRVARQMTGAAAQVVRNSARRKAPKHPVVHKIDGVVVQPGNLRRNIVGKFLGKKSALTSEHIVTVRGKKKDGFAHRYGRFVEFGTVKMSPIPFLRPAFDENVSKAIDVMADRGWKGIESAAKKQNKAAKK